jgi:hypothetical protein
VKAEHKDNVIIQSGGPTDAPVGTIFSTE